MALRFPSRANRQDLGPRDSPPADSPPPTSQGGSGNGARAAVARKTKEVEHMLANLEKAGVEINDKIASIIEDEVAIIKAEAAREKNINGLKTIGAMVLFTLSTAGIGFIVGEEVHEQAFYANVVKKIIFGEY